MFLELKNYNNENEIILKSCDVLSFNIKNNYLDRELNIAISTATLTILNTKENYLYFSKIKKITPVKLVYQIESEIKEIDLIINPILNLPLKKYSDLFISLVSPLTLFNIESPKVEYKDLIKKDDRTYINFEGESIFETLSKITNNINNEEIRILKVNFNKCQVINKYTYTFLINEGDNILNTIKRLCYEFSLVIYWEDGIIIKDLKTLLKQSPQEREICINEDVYNEEIILPIQNRLTISWTDKNFKSILELLEEDLKAVYNEKGRENEGKIEPLKPLFEKEFYPDYSDQYDNIKIIETGFLNRKLQQKKDGEIIGILSRNVKTEINPILLIEDALILFNPYNEYFKRLDPTKEIMSKDDFYKKYEINKEDKIFKLIENRYPTNNDPDWKVDHPSKVFLMLRKFKSAEQSVIFSFQTQPRLAMDPLKPLYINIFWIQVFASTHYRNTEFTMKPLEIVNRRENRKELYLYVNDLNFINEEYSFRQTLFLNGFSIVQFETLENLEILKVYNLFNPLTEEFNTFLIFSKEINFKPSQEIKYNYIGSKIFNFSLENNYLVEILTSILDISRKEMPILLKTIWDDNLRSSYYTHFYIDNLPKLAIDGADKNGIALVGYYTMYFINEIPASESVIRQGQGLRRDLLLITPRNEIEKVKEKFKKLFSFEPQVLEIKGVETNIFNQEIIIEGDFEGKVFGGETYFAYPYRENF